MTLTTFHSDGDAGGGVLTQAQILMLVTSVDPNHVEDKRGMSYMAQYQVRAELTRIFGYGNWDTKVLDMSMLYERPIRHGEEGFPANAKNKDLTYWVVGYRAAVELNIRDYHGRPVCSFLEYHAEENAPLPNRGEAHAMAMTSVESYALRRAAIGLGDRFGLSLYKKGSKAALVQRTLQLDDPQSPQVFRQQSQPQTGQPQITVPAAVGQMREQDARHAQMAQGLKVDARDGANA